MFVVSAWTACPGWNSVEATAKEAHHVHPSHPGPDPRPDEVRALMQEWDATTDNEASGFLGATNGVTDDGMFIGVVRFESKEKAMANSARPETDAMAKRFAELMDGPPEFHDCDDVSVWRTAARTTRASSRSSAGRRTTRTALKEMMTGDTDGAARDATGDHRRHFRDRGRRHLDQTSPSPTRLARARARRRSHRPSPRRDPVAHERRHVLRPARSLVHVGLPRDDRQPRRRPPGLVGSSTSCRESSATLSVERAAAAYGIPADGPDLAVVLRHRAVLLTIVGLGAGRRAVVAGDPRGGHRRGCHQHGVVRRDRPRQAGRGPPLRKVMWIDVGALVLVAVAVMLRSAG